MVLPKIKRKRFDEIRTFFVIFYCFAGHMGLPEPFVHQPKLRLVALVDGLSQHPRSHKPLHGGLAEFLTSSGDVSVCGRRDKLLLDGLGRLVVRIVARADARRSSMMYEDDDDASPLAPAFSVSSGSKVLTM